MSKKKVLILLSDGISLKNFAYTNFYKKSMEKELDVVFWNSTSFNLKEMGLKEKKLPFPRLHKLTDIHKTARKHIELNLFEKKFSNPVFSTYKFPFSKRSLKARLKSFLCQSIIFLNNSEHGLVKVKHKIDKLERKTTYYQECINVLKTERPQMVFSTSQRPVIGIAPILAAKDLGIPTVTFIYSWDNLPKATMVIETDYYFVWSDYMKKELLKYYPHVKAENIIVTGTPQFENHLEDIVTTKEAFFAEYNLDINKKYICYSGDDITTCPDDADYLADVAKAITTLNSKGHNLGIIFRRCPVDFSDRFDHVLNEYKDIIVPIAPKWEKRDEQWNTIFPTKEDMTLLKQTSRYTEMVINLGSTMVFDYVAQKKPCAYINYDVKNKRLADWSVEKVYQYIHFESMPKKESVVWLNSPEYMANDIEEVLNNGQKNIEAAQDWFKVINLHPITNASDNILKEIKTII